MRCTLASLLIAPVLLVLWALPLAARPGLFIGAGLATQNETGDFKGKPALTSTDGTQTIVPGQPGAGNGLAFMAGYGFNRYIGVELDLAATSNIASAHVAGFPAKSSSSVSTDMICARVTLPVSNAWDLFARLGLAQASMNFGSFEHDYLGTIGTVSDEVTFHGKGYGAGLGVEYFVNHVGLGLGWTRYQIQFDTTSASAMSALPRKLNEAIDQADLTAAYHF